MSTNITPNRSWVDFQNRQMIREADARQREAEYAEVDKLHRDRSRSAVRSLRRKQERRNPPTASPAPTPTPSPGAIPPGGVGGSATPGATELRRVPRGAIVVSPEEAPAVMAAIDLAVQVTEQREQRRQARGGSMTASAAPVAPPRSWFEIPEASGPTPITVTDDGQVYGHLATWNVCHIASPNGADVCVTAPHSARRYAQFHTGTVKAADGTLVSTGRITLNTGHAGPRLNAVAAAAHYDHTGTAVADVRAVDGEHGIWVAGALRPGVSDETKRVLRASPLSGDWRRIGGSLELVAALAVNVPGFPIPHPVGLIASARPHDLVDAGELLSLVAAGIVPMQRRQQAATQRRMTI